MTFKHLKEIQKTWKEKKRQFVIKKLQISLIYFLHFVLFEDQFLFKNVELQVYPPSIIKFATAENTKDFGYDVNIQVKNSKRKCSTYVHPIDGKLFF